MCYHNSLTAKAQKLSARFSAGLIEPPDFRPIFHEHGYEHKPRPIVIREDETRFLAAGWGLIPKWVKTVEKAHQMGNGNLNAKSETIFELPSFREAILHRRCLIPSTGFYDSKEVSKNSYPYRVFLKHEEIFCLAGIWEEWTNPETKEVTRRYSMLTTPPNKKFSQIHTRMPLILPREVEEIWIDPSMKDQKDIKPLLQIYPDENMDFYTIRKFRPGDEFDEDILEKVDYIELSQQELF
ncbi:SOS response-associated peptidase [Leptospira barantonii]|uniref:SOS response-associated peptidase n=1 Tax=Leptospira barantonii TaxID=2023184 RepID=UPI0014384AB4|nr:SOS response-associated peptidase [Leptospira barantonii]